MWKELLLCLWHSSADWPPVPHTVTLTEALCFLLCPCGRLSLSVTRRHTEAQTLKCKRGYFVRPKRMNSRRLACVLKVYFMIVVKALNSTAKQTHPSPQCSFKLARVTHSITLSCVRARVVTYYTEVFGGNVAKTSVFLFVAVCFPITEPGLCMCALFFQCTHRTES